MSFFFLAREFFSLRCLWHRNRIVILKHTFFSAAKFLGEQSINSNRNRYIEWCEIAFRIICHIHVAINLCTSNAKWYANCIYSASCPANAENLDPFSIFTKQICLLSHYYLLCVYRNHTINTMIVC